MRSTYGLNCAYVRFSAIFSTPRCRYPMMHSVPRTFSPSSLRMTRSTPCVDGCWGPMFRTSSVESKNVESGILSSLAAIDIQVFLHPALILLKNSVFLAQRISLPLFRQQNSPHVRVAGEFDAEHVEHFPLQPVGGQVHPHRGLRLETVGDISLDAHSLVAREAVGDVDQVETFGPLGPIHRGDVHQ